MYVVKQTRHLYGPKDITTTVCDRNGHIMTFDSLELARQWISTREAEYVAYPMLAHGEYATPSYVPKCRV